MRVRYDERGVEQATLEWRAEGRTPEGQAVRLHGANAVTVENGCFTEFRADWCTTTAS